MLCPQRCCPREEPFQVGVYARGNTDEDLLTRLITCEVLATVSAGDVPIECRYYFDPEPMDGECEEREGLEMLLRLAETGQVDLIVTEQLTTLAASWEAYQPIAARLAVHDVAVCCLFGSGMGDEQETPRPPADSGIAMHYADLW